MLTVLFRTFIVYFVLLISMKLMGKRQVGELQLSELVTTFMLSELAVIPIGDKNIPLFQALFPILLLLSLEVIFSFTLTKINPLKKFVYGKPSILISRGSIDQAELARLRISVDELLSELRQKDVSDISDVDYAVLEDNGKLSVIKKNAGGFHHPVIIDGAIIEEELAKCGIAKSTLFASLSQRGLAVPDVFLLTVSDDNETLLIIKEEQYKDKGGKDK